MPDAAGSAHEGPPLGTRRVAQETLFILFLHHLCSIRVSSVAKRIFLTHLASFFAPNQGFEGYIPLWLCGLRLVAARFEFWQHGDDRLHDRFTYRREGETWIVERLGP